MSSPTSEWLHDLGIIALRRLDGNIDVFGVVVIMVSYSERVGYIMDILVSF